jgi:hypothetical protein
VLIRAMLADVDETGFGTLLTRRRSTIIPRIAPGDVIPMQNPTTPGGVVSRVMWKSETTFFRCATTIA